MKIIEAQMMHSFARILYTHAEIISGAYKFRQLEQGTEPSEEEKKEGRIRFKPLTDDEKLRHCMSTMQAHCDRLRDCLNALPPDKKELCPMCQGRAKGGSAAADFVCSLCNGAGELSV